MPVSSDAAQAGSPQIETCHHLLGKRLGTRLNLLRVPPIRAGQLGIEHESIPIAYVPSLSVSPVALVLETLVAQRAVEARDGDP